MRLISLKNENPPISVFHSLDPLSSTWKSHTPKEKEKKNPLNFKHNHPEKFSCDPGSSSSFLDHEGQDASCYEMKMDKALYMKLASSIHM